METKNNKILYILLGIGAGIGVYYFLCKRKKQTPIVNKSSEQITE
jgi:hypothetical protein